MQAYIPFAALKVVLPKPWEHTQAREPTLRQVARTWAIPWRHACPAGRNVMQQHALHSHSLETSTPIAEYQGVVIVTGLQFTRCHLPVGFQHEIGDHAASMWSS
jgi:hypothetical protein